MKNLILISVLIIFMGCVKSDGGNCVPSQIEIMSNSSIIDVMTKTPSDDIPSGARVLVTKVSGNYSSPYENGTMPFASGNGNPVGFDGGPIYYPLDSPTVYMTAFNPAFGWRFAGSNGFCDYSGSQDILCATEVPTTIAQAQQGIYPTMAFKHVMTQLLIRVQASSAAAALWGNIVDVTFVSAMGQPIKDSIQVNTSTGVCAPNMLSNDTSVHAFQITDGGTVFTDNILSGLSIPIPDSFLLIGYSLCIPVTATASDVEYTLLVKTTNVPDGVSIPVNLKQSSPSVDDFVGTTQGYAFTINLNFVTTSIIARATVQPWENRGGADIIVSNP